MKNMAALKVNNENICQLNRNIDQNYLKHLMANCETLQERKFIYTDHKINFSKTFIKSSTHYHKSFYHYYRVQILEPTLRGREVKKYEVEETWGTFESSDHQRHTEKYLRDAAVKTFLLYTSETHVKNKFSTMISLVEKKRSLDFSMEKLLKDIINCDFLMKVMEEYELDVKKVRKISSKLCIQMNKNNQTTIVNVDLLSKMFAGKDAKRVKKLVQKLLDRGVDLPLSHKISEKNAYFLSIFYQKLGTRIEVLDPSTDCFKVILKYVKDTHSPHHGTYTLQVQSVFNIQRPDDKGLFMDQIGNKQLLWHGTKKENIASILSEGFKVPQVPSHGRMFGHGIYFSNSVSKAANYCSCHQENSEGYLLLCEVALGNTMELYKAQQNMWTLPLGIHSIVGKGLFSPYFNDTVTIYQDVKVPYGEIVKNVFSPNTGLIHDEFIVFTTSQIRIRHVVAVKFEFKAD